MMNNNREKLVSIGMPTYNRARYIRGSLDTILSQTYKNFELIISDNASTDETQRICEEYTKKDSRIRYIRQKENIGPLNNFDFVLKKAEGIYFMWAADDDLWNKNFIRSCAVALNNNSKSIMAFGNLSHIDAEGIIKKKNIPSDYFPFGKDSLSRLKRYLLLYGCEGKATLIYGLWRREVILNEKIKNHLGSDTNFVFKNLLKGEFIFTKDALFYTRGRKYNKNFLRKLFNQILHRLQILSSPYFYYYFNDIVEEERLSLSCKLQLIFCNLLTMLRLFYSYRI